MGTKSEYIAKINKIPTISFNKEQKEIAKKIIESTDENDLDAVYGLITQRVKTGFVFDEAPEVNHNCVALVKENKKLNIVGDGLNPIEHKLIIGENYDALKNLCATYIDKSGKGLIDVIYIDPPYNTEATKKDGNDYKEEIEATKFIYRDKFTRDGWLNMMNERLRLAKRLLSDKGVIFISIDDSEQAYLKVLCDEIFGENNFVVTFPRVTKKGGKSSESTAKNHDYVLMYTKHKNVADIIGITHNDSGYSNKDEFFEVRGCYKLNQTLDYDSLGYVSSLDYPIEINGETFYAGGSKEDYKNRIKGKHKRADWAWRWSRELFDFGYKNGFIEIKKSGNRPRIYTKTYQNVKIEFNEGKYEIINIDRTKPMSTIEFTDSKYSNDNAKKEISKLELGEFDYPKPTSLIYQLLKLISNKKSKVLDFFAGTGTTGQAVMELNEEDGGQRQFILVTNNENNIGTEITRERLYRVIKGKGSKGEKFNWTYTTEKPYLSANNVTVFDIEQTNLTLKDLEKAEKIRDFAKVEFKKLNPNCSLNNDFDVYNELAALNPQKGDK